MNPPVLHDAVVLDTDVCSFLFKQNRRGERYLPHLANKTVCLSFQTIAELYQGIEMAGWSETRQARLRDWLTRFVVLPYDDEFARLWAHIRVERRKQPISAQGAWIAASALRYSCPLITHNASRLRGDCEPYDHHRAGLCGLIDRPALRGNTLDNS